MDDKNYAFIDAQNLVAGTYNDGWSVDVFKLRKYLKEKYKVQKAYYFIGVYEKEKKALYGTLRKAGYNLIFREHTPEMTAHKKGNVDTDIVFSVMSKIILQEKFDKVILISGDGDYHKMVDFLIKKNRFLKLLAPSKAGISSLYAKVPGGYIAHLDESATKQKLIRTKINHQKSSPFKR